MASRSATPERLDPFWLTDTLLRESVMFVGEADGTTDARLLFQPETNLAVESASGQCAYVEGLDFAVDCGARRLVRLAGSRAPCVARPATGNGTLTHDQTVFVSYAHPRDRWNGSVPPDRSADLPRLARLVRSRDPLTLCFCGDSITEGYDASGFHGLPPSQPPFAALVRSRLREQFSIDVRMHNFGTAGWTAADALWDTDRVAAAHPDLVVVAFGMNDAAYARAEQYGADVARLLDRIRLNAPDVEFVVVSPMLPTPACHWLQRSLFPHYRDRLAGLAGSGVALADLTTLWMELEDRKGPQSLSGNGWNHPNDFGHRVYAQTILATLGCATVRSADSHV